MTVDRKTRIALRCAAIDAFRKIYDLDRSYLAARRALQDEYDVTLRSMVAAGMHQGLSISDSNIDVLRECARDMHMESTGA